MNDPRQCDKQEFLLDTGVFYALSQAHSRALLENRQHIRLTASVAVPFELLSGLPRSTEPSAEKQFRVRRAALEKYLSLVGFANTYWDLPSTLRKRAFGLAGSGRPASSFQALVLLCTRSRSILEIENAIRQAHVLSSAMPSLQWLAEQADAVSEGFARAFEVGKKLFAATTQAQLPSDDLSTSREQERLVRGFVPYLHHVGDLGMYVFLSLAAQAGVWDGQLPRSGLYDACVTISERLRGRYDGSLDFYIGAFAEYWAEKWLDGGSPDRNDSFDLDHILYLRKNDATQVFVTTDKSLASRCLRVAPGRAINLKSFVEFMAGAQRPL